MGNITVAPLKRLATSFQGNALDKRVSNLMQGKGGSKKDIIYLTASDIEENFSCDVDTANQIVRLFTMAKSEHDKKNSPPDTVSARDLAAVLAILSDEPLKTRLQFLFKFFDLDGNAELTHSEVEDMLWSLLSLSRALGPAASPAHRACYDDLSRNYKQRVDDIWKQLDRNSDGTINEEEFIQYASKDSLILSFLFTLGRLGEIPANKQMHKSIWNKPVGDSSFRILALDGGGIRGLMSAIILKRISEKFPGFLDSIDMFTGTSTGSIIATLLAVETPLDEVVALYRQHAHQIFAEASTLGQLFSAKYDPKNFIALVKERISDVQLRHIDRKLLIPTFSLAQDISVNSRDGTLEKKHWGPQLHHNFPAIDPMTKAPLPIQTHLNELVGDVVLKSAAAPVYFPAYGGSVDGGLASNNPSVSALIVASSPRFGGVDPKDIRIFSVGTGVFPQTSTGFSILRLDTLSVDIKNLISASMDGPTQLNDQVLSIFLQQHYCRVQPLLPAQIELDSYHEKDLNLLQEIGETIKLDDHFKWISDIWFNGAPDGAPSVSEMINHAPEKVATMENQSVVNEDEKMNAQRMREYLNRMSQGFQPVISSGLYGPEIYPLPNMQIARGPPDYDMTFEIMFSGDVFVLHFFNTFAPPSVRSLVSMKDTIERWGSKGVQFLDIARDETFGSFSTFLKQRADIFGNRIIACDETDKTNSTSVTKRYFEPLQIPSVPFVAVYGRDRTLRWAGHPSKPEFEKTVGNCVTEPRRTVPKQQIPLIRTLKKDVSTIKSKDSIDILKRFLAWPVPQEVDATSKKALVIITSGSPTPYIAGADNLTIDLKPELTRFKKSEVQQAQGIHFYGAAGLKTGTDFTKQVTDARTAQQSGPVSNFEFDLSTIGEPVAVCWIYTNQSAPDVKKFHYRSQVFRQIFTDKIKIEAPASYKTPLEIRLSHLNPQLQFMAAFIGETDVTEKLIEIQKLRDADIDWIVPSDPAEYGCANATSPLLIFKSTGYVCVPKNSKVLMDNTSNRKTIKVVIDGAVYGRANVKEKVQQMVSKSRPEDNTQIPAINNVFGDSWVGIAKTLTVSWHYETATGGTTPIFTLNAAEGTTLQLPGPAYYSGPIAVEEYAVTKTPVQILGATYGRADVTYIIREKFEEAYLAGKDSLVLDAEEKNWPPTPWPYAFIKDIFFPKIASHVTSKEGNDLKLVWTYSSHVLCTVCKKRSCGYFYRAEKPTEPLARIHQAVHLFCYEFPPVSENMTKELYSLIQRDLIRQFIVDLPAKYKNTSYVPAFLDTIFIERMPQKAFDARHDHELTLMRSQDIGGLYGAGGYKCNVCSAHGLGGVFHCFPCMWDAHTYCFVEKASAGPLSTPEIHEVVEDPDILAKQLREKDAELQKAKQALTNSENAAKEAERLLSLSITMERMFAEKMPKVISDKRHSHSLTLSLCAKMPGDYPTQGFQCSFCKTNGNSWMYHCETCKFDAHLPCANVSYIPDGVVSTPTSPAPSSATSTTPASPNVEKKKGFFANLTKSSSKKKEEKDESKEKKEKERNKDKGLP